jgi:hypothetical protein
MKGLVGGFVRMIVLPSALRIASGVMLLSRD